MKGSPASQLRPLVILAAFLVAVLAAPIHADPEKPREGRFLYAGDDDWDWASPLGAEVPSKLSKYGAMPWSALDWAEEGLKDVRGVLVGTPPNIGKYLTLEGLGELRGENKNYLHQPQEAGVIAKVLGADLPPNLIILMQDTGKGGRLGDDDVRGLTDFVKGGGRLVVLDDWSRYPPVMEAVLEAALARPREKWSPVDPIKKEADPDLELDKEFVEQVRGLVGDLGSANFRTRENAMFALRKLGPPALELADELRPDDPEIAARLARLGAELKPKASFAGGAVADGGRREKHLAAAKRVMEGAAKLELAGIPHSVDTVHVDKEGAPLSSLKLVFPSN